MRQQVENALKDIRPMLLRDGGDVSLISAKDGVVTVRLSGRCSHCEMSTITLKRGIEEQLKKVVPGVLEVRQESVLNELRPAAILEPSFTPESCPLDTAVTQDYRAEHRRLRTMLGQMSKALSGRVMRGIVITEEKNNLMALGQFLNNDFFEHMRREETDLFPALKARLNWGDPVSAMIREHVELRRLIGEYNEALAASELGGPDKLSGAGAVLSNAILEHLFREENVVYFEADDVLREAPLAYSTQQ